MLFYVNIDLILLFFLNALLFCIFIDVWLKFDRLDIYKSGFLRTIRQSSKTHVKLKDFIEFDLWKGIAFLLQY